MKKRITLVLLIIILFLITGCETSIPDNNDSSKKEGIVAKINDEEISLDYERDFNNLYYKENVVSLHSDTLGSNRVINYSQNGSVVLSIRMTYIEDMTIEKTKTQLNFETKTKKIGDLEYLYGEWTFKDSSTEIEYKAYQYFYEFNNTTYTICFITNEDITDFETKFMSTVYFK